MSTSGTGTPADRYVLELDVMAQTVAVTMGDTGERLYRVTTASGDPAPVVRVDGSTVHVGAAGRITSVEVVLRDDVPWALQTGSGIGLLQVDATHGALAGLTARANIAGIYLTAAVPVGKPVISVADGLSDLRLHFPDDTAVQVHAGGGAGVISLFGDRTRDVPAGDIVATPGFGDTGYVVDLAGGGVHSVVVD